MRDSNASPSKGMHSIGLYDFAREHHVESLNVRECQASFIEESSSVCYDCQLITRFVELLNALFNAASVPAVLFLVDKHVLVALAEIIVPHPIKVIAVNIFSSHESCCQE